MLYRASSIWARVEITAAATLAASVTGLILLNVVTRAAGNAIYWVDEAAIYAMVWMTVLAASAALHFRSAIAVTVVKEILPHHACRWLDRFVDLTAFVFACLMVWICLRWFMPLQLMQTGWDVKAFQGQTFNFIYAEPTNTLGLPKVWVWLVMPLFTLGALLHSAANLLHPEATPRSEGDA
ncbi:TRAP-type C4-dicarboxylate transport system, small permease component [Cribrihabitans marinus]|uniref:TRAP transporter small permease protein n=1 Tax=Cribrihabitans marinus TaxID=1227549 RepID=A0A1H6ZR14_9RHOB|nr:TRAP transporter small permease subunit [Cribrihabitans marinus]GGH30780.1 C4-dicarboxylate ABC transporter permease [Cribrihabitans marinus]SEJ52050.1 TRAP-type C4-dicarboxylate transport system, small permease component [Cribrihabitans marinus]